MAGLKSIGDYHWYHKNLVLYRNCHGDLTCDQMRERDMDLHNDAVDKDDTVMYLGDMIFDRAGLEDIKKLNGRKKVLIAGNHCTEFVTMRELCEVFDEVHAMKKKNHKLFTHVPVHEESLRGRYNVHAHTHCDIIKDPRYLCVSVDALEWNDFKPVSMDQINNRLKWQNKNPEEFFKFAQHVIDNQKAFTNERQPSPYDKRRTTKNY